MFSKGAKFAKSRVAVVVAAVMLAVRPVAAELPQAVVNYGREFAQGVASCRAAYVSATNQLPAKYLKDLEALQKQFQEAGDLDSLLVVKRESQRFAKARMAEPDPFEPVPEMMPDDIVASPQELRRLQEQYVIGFTEALEAMKTGIAERGEKYKTQFKAAQASLTKAGLIEEAIEVRNEADRVAAIIDSGRIDELLDKQIMAAATAALAGNAQEGVATEASKTDEKQVDSPAARWKYRGSHPFSRDLKPRYFAPDVPDEIKVLYSKAKSAARLTGRCTVSAAQVDDVLCSWNGRALLWDVADIDSLPADLRLRSRTLSSGDDRGPHVEIAVFLALESGGVKFLKALSVPMQRAEEIAKIRRESPKSRRFAISWPRAQKSAVFEIPEGGKVRLLIGSVLHNVGETCDMSILIESPTD